MSGHDAQTTDGQRAAMPSPFPPIADYAFLSDCHTGALIAPDGAVTEIAWSAPKDFVLETIAPDRRGGLWIVGLDATFWAASVAEDRVGPLQRVAAVGSAAGAVAITSDGALLLGDRPKLWMLSRPEPATAGAPRPRHPWRCGWRRPGRVDFRGRPRRLPASIRGSSVGRAIGC